MRQVIINIMKLVRLSGFIPAILFLASCHGNIGPGTGTDPGTDPVVGPEPTTASIRVMYFNSRISGGDGKDAQFGCDWPNRKAACFEMINDVKPDVIAFNEVDENQLGDYSSNLSDYANVPAAGDVYSGNYIFYSKSAVEPIDGTAGRFWLGPDPDTSYYGWLVDEERDNDHQSCTYCKFKELATGEEFWVFCTHPSYLFTENVLKGCKLILERMAAAVTDDTPVFLGGDMNALEWSSPIYVVREKMAVAREVATVTDNYPTYNAWGRKAGYNDMIFAKGKVQIDTFRTVVQQYGTAPYVSDHYPVVVDATIGTESVLAVPLPERLAEEEYQSNQSFVKGSNTGKVSSTSVCLYEDEETVYPALKLGTKEEEGAFTFYPINIGDITLSFIANSWYNEQSCIKVSASFGALVDGKQSVSISPVHGAEGLTPDFKSPRHSDIYSFNITGVTEDTEITISATMPESDKEYFTSSCRTLIYGLRINGGTPRPDSDGSGVAPIEYTDEYIIF